MLRIPPPGPEQETEQPMDSMIEALILGVVQGLTEFLPISSSAHLRITGALFFDGRDPGATFTAVTQLGTELAVLVFFFKDIVRIIRRWYQSLYGGVPRNDPDARMGWLIIIGTIPIVVVGYLAQDAIRTSLRSLWITAFVLIGFGILLGLVDLLGRRTKTLTELSYRDGLLYGAAQTLALVPGVSRSGATISMGRLLGYDRPSAARYAFLLAVPAVFGSGLYELSKLDEAPPGGYGMTETMLATGVSFVVGLAVIAFLMRYISKRSFLPFVVYRILLGGALIALLSAGVLQPY